MTPHGPAPTERRLMWCETHGEPAWLYADGSHSCWYDSIVEANTEHSLTELPQVQRYLKLVADLRVLRYDYITTDLLAALFDQAGV